VTVVDVCWWMFVGLDCGIHFSSFSSFGAFFSFPFVSFCPIQSLNHSSIVNGARASGSTIRVFKHDNPSHLEQVLRNAIIAGQPRTSRPWKKILVVCEGIYSMEGEIGHFKEIVDVCKKHKAYVYVDEAHSIGALGATGRGVAEKCGVDTADIDIMMGTFTKSFGGMGGYIAGSKDLIDYIRATSSGMIYSNAMSPIICKQILRALQVIMGLDGTDIGQRKLDDLRNNSNYFRKGLVNMGLQVLGDADSPVMPVLLYNPTKIGAFSRECLKRGLAVVCVGFPATPLIESRARFCISAGHTKENLDYALEQIDEIADLLKLKYDANWLG
jgi:serine palmitoyltransferase